MNDKRIITGIVLTAIIALGFYALYGERQSEPEPRTSPKIHSVVLTDRGFEPRESIIGVGDTIVFSTTRGRPYWPASNLHPTHSIFPAFDPREPISPDEEWRFTFKKRGRWNFHDHLQAHFVGVIEVQ